MLVLATYGGGNLIGGLFVGQIIKRSNSHKKTLIFFIVWASLTFLLIIVYTITFQFNYTPFVFGVMWGVMDSGLNSHNGIILGFEFNDKTIPAYGL